MQLDCTVRCRSHVHAGQINAAITRGTSEQVKAYCRSLCHNFFCVSDDLGKNALHVAASCGKWEIVEWLLENYNIHVDVRDGESGWTALHRSLFYGQLASANVLLKHKANLRVTDHDGLNPLELVMLDRLPYIEYLPSNPCEVYLWGSNSNFNLGLDKQQSRENPEILEAFRRENVSIKQVVMCKFHSVFLSHDGRAFTCGLGRGGRLGQNVEGACLVPTPVQGLGALSCERVASGQDHLVLLMENGQVWTCGTNTYHQLGHTPPPDHLMIPRPINLKFLKAKNIVGVCAARYHSVFYTEDALFTFGLNAGQLGHPKGDKFQSNPRQVSSVNEKNSKITHVAVSDGATVCATSKGDVIVQHEYQCRKIASRQLEIKKLSVLGGHLDSRYMQGIKEIGDHELRVVILTLSGRVYIWREGNPVLTRCIFAVGRELSILDLEINHYSILLATCNGEGFMGYINARKEKQTASTETAQGGPTSPSVSSKMVTSLVPLLEKDECDIIRIKRIPYIHRAVAVSCDSKGRNFAILQSHPKTGLLDLPNLPLSNMEKDFAALLDEASKFDLIHDVVIKVENREYLAHKYILAFRSEFFRKQFLTVDSALDGLCEVVVEYVKPEAFEKVLQFIYCNSCDLLRDGKTVKWKKAIFQEKDDTTNNVNSDFQSKKSCPNLKVKKKKKSKSQASENNASNENPIVEVQDASRRLGVPLLTKRLASVKIVDGKIKLLDHSPLPKLKFDRQKLTNLHDVTLKAEDGKEFACHKCVLTARLEYFRSMLGSGWIETSSTQALLLPVPSKVLEVVIDYLYSDQASKVFASEDAEFVCQVLVIADQLLITNLKQMCEVALVDMITLKNASELLELSYIYNATQLKASCLQYICINLPAVLETGGFEILSDDALIDLTSAYRNLLPKMASRVITPYSTGPTDEEFNTFAQQAFSEESPPCPISMGIVEKAKSKRKSVSRKISSNSSDQEGRIRKNSSSESGYCTSASSPPLKQLDQNLTLEAVESPPPPSPSPSIDIPPVTSALICSSKPKESSPKWNKGSWVVSKKTVASPSLKDIMLEEEHKDQRERAPSDSKKSIRVTPKQWKKMPLTVTPPVASPVGHSSPPGSMTATSCPWGNIPLIQPQQSFWEAVKTDNFVAGASNVFASSPPSDGALQVSTPRLGDILKAEETEQKNMAKYKAKPLHLIHIEDQAIEELFKFYCAADNPDERITVQRVLPENVAAPVWKKHASNFR